MYGKLYTLLYIRALLKGIIRLIHPEILVIFLRVFKKMKISLFFIAIFLVGCNSILDNEFYKPPSLSNHSIQKIKTHELGLNYYFQGYLQSRIDDEEYLIGIDLRNNKLDFIDKKNENKSFQLTFPTDGANAITNNILSLSIRENNLFILTSHSFYITTISIKDQSLVVKNKVELGGSNYGFISSNINISFTPNFSLFALDENHVYIPFFLGSFMGDKQFFEENNLKTLNISSNKNQDYFIEWPISLLYDNDEFLHPLNQRFFPLKVNDEMFISFPFSSQVQKVVLEENSTRVEQGFGIQHEILDDEIITTPFRKGERLGEMHINGFSNNASFLPLRYNHIKDRLFRIFFTAQKEEFIDKKPWIREREKILFEYSLDGKILSETMIPANLDMDPVVMKDGSYWFPVWKDVLDEDFMEFVVYR